MLAAATTQRAIGWVIFALAIVGFVVISMYLPMFKVYDTIQ